MYRVCIKKREYRGKQAIETSPYYMQGQAILNLIHLELRKGYQVGHIWVEKLAGDVKFVMSPHDFARQVSAGQIPA